jgi:hypothetical protein
MHRTATQANINNPPKYLNLFPLPCQLQILLHLFRQLECVCVCVCVDEAGTVKLHDLGFARYMEEAEVCVCVCVCVCERECPQQA